MKKLFLAAIMAAMCFALAACGGEAENGQGAEFGSFTSSDLDGNEVTEAVFADKDVTVLNVWATYCGPCKDEMPDLGEWSRELPDNAQIIGVVIDVPEGDADMIGTAREICSETGVSFTNITANDSVNNIMNSIEAVPTTFILDSSGKTVCEPIIGADIESYKKAVQEYLDQLD